MAEWKSLSIQVPGQDLLEPVRNVLETLLVFLDILKAILNTIKVFLIDFGNPIRALVESLIRLIEELFQSLKTTGVSALFHVPNPLVDPNFAFNKGYDAFPNTFKQSLFDFKDFNRPQPRPGSNRGGFVLLMVQADSPFAIIGKILQLLKFFSKEFTAPRFEEPRNFKVVPVGENGDPILAVADLFSDEPIQSIGLSWTLPTSAETPDTGFSDLVSRVAAEFVPPKFLIEKSTINPAAQIIDISDIKDGDSAGRVEFEREVSVAGTNTPAVRRELLRDSNGELVVKFTETILLDQTDITSLLGQLGTFRYIDSDIELDQTYYYRVRALVGDLKLTGSNQIDWGDPLTTDGRGIPTVRWPSNSESDDAIVMPGKPTGILSARVPTPISGFDVVQNLRRVFQAAFSLDFHREVPEGFMDFTVGSESLLNLAGSVGGKDFGVLYGQLNGLAAQGFFDFEVANGPITYPWEEGVVRKRSAVLADAMASALITAGSGPINNFRDLMQSSNPLLGESTLEGAVFRVTGGEGEGPGGTDDTITTDDKGSVWISAYNSEDFRTELLEVINFIKAFIGGGISPDWITISPLRDIIPWSGQLIYELLAKIQSLLDAFSGVVDEIKAFIDLLIRKINTLERTLEFLISILDLIQSLQLGAYLLAVPDIEGDASAWVDAVNTATNPPPAGNGGYSAGVALAYVAPDISAFKTAFSVIFGA